MRLKFILTFFCALVFCSNVYAQSAFDSDFFDEQLSYETPDKRKNFVFVDVRGKIHGSNFLAGPSFGYGRNNIFISKQDTWNDFFSIGIERLFATESRMSFLFLRYGLEFKFEFCKWCVFGFNGLLQGMMQPFFDVIDWNVIGGLEGFMKIKALYPLDFIVGGELGVLLPSPDLVAGLKLGALFYF